VKGALTKSQLTKPHFVLSSEHTKEVCSGMAQELVADELWGLIEPLLPPPRPQPKGGRRPKPNRAVLTGIVFVLKSGIP
jgi:hypothetical protein